MTTDDIEHAKTIGDGLSITVAVGTLVQFLPSIAALLTVIWTAIRIYETETVKRFMRWCRRKSQGSDNVAE